MAIDFKRASKAEKIVDVVIGELMSQPTFRVAFLSVEEGLRADIRRGLLGKVELCRI